MHVSHDAECRVTGGVLRVLHVGVAAEVAALLCVPDAAGNERLQGEVNTL